MKKKKRNRIKNVKILDTGIRYQNNAECMAGILYNVKEYDIFELFDGGYSDCIGIPKLLVYDGEVFKVISRKKNRKNKRLKRVGRL